MSNEQDSWGKVMSLVNGDQGDVVAVSLSRPDSWYLPEEENFIQWLNNECNRLGIEPADIPND